MSDSNKRPVIRFSEEQEQLLEVASSFARERFPLSRARARMAAAEDFDAAIWHEMVSLGWLGIAVPEEYGGSGLGLGGVVTIAEPLGRQVAGTPFVSTTLAALTLMKVGTRAQCAAWLPRISQGAVATLALSEHHGDWDLTHIACKASRKGDALVLSGTKTFVTDARSAELVIASVLVDGAPALVLLPRENLDGPKCVRETVIDETRRSYRLVLDGVTVPVANLLETAKTRDALQHIHLAACLLLSAEMCGGADSAIALTTDYLKTRKQFGRTIGSYQALKHPLVDALVQFEAARSHLYYAASVFADDTEGEIAVRMAKASASEALAFAADRAIQFHGGFGFTYDCDAQLFRRRGLWCEYQHGDAAYHRARLAELLL